jgi:macrodomain Ter protein organizer (MatP/YcbG family)
MGPENAHGCARNAENGLGFVFLERYHEDGDEFLNHIVRVTGDATGVSCLNIETKEQSAAKEWMHVHSANKPKKLKQTLSACQKADGNCFLGQERSADGGIHATWDNNNFTSVLRNTKKKMRRAIQNKRGGMQTYGVFVVLLQDNARRQTGTVPRFRALPELFNWELFDLPPYSPDLASSYYHLFTYLKYWLRSQRFSNNEKFMEGVKMWQLTGARLL